MASHLDHPNFPSEHFYITRDTAIPAAPVRGENEAVSLFTRVGAFYFLTPQPSRRSGGEKNDVGFRRTQKHLKPTFLERGDCP